MLQHRWLDAALGGVMTIGIIRYLWHRMKAKKREELSSLAQHVTIVGIPHRIQGANGRARNVDDPDYSEVLDLLLTGDIDFVFEEACGFLTTGAALAKARLGPNRYADLDPPERSEAARTGRTDEPHRGDQRIWRHHYREQEKREVTIWLQVLREHSFDRALLICGYLHLLTIANRLSAAGYDVDALQYMPWNRLCTHEQNKPSG